MASDESKVADETGRRMLEKMGWKGGGLGKDERGRRTPISVGEQGTQGLGKREADADALDNAAKAPAQKVQRTKAKQGPKEFFCELCVKQYSTVTEFAHHLSSYDHHHKKRFSEMKRLQQRPTTKHDDRTLQERIDRCTPVENPVETVRPPAVKFTSFSLKKKGRR